MKIVFLALFMVIPVFSFAENLKENDLPEVFQKAREFDDKNMHAEAIEEYTKAITAEPKLAFLGYFFRGNVYIAEWDFPKAISDFSKSIELNPQYYLTYFARGYSYVELKDYENAIVDFNRSIGVNPLFGQAYAERAKAYFFKKDYKKSSDDFRKAKEFGGKVDLRLADAVERIRGDK